MEMLLNTTKKSTTAGNIAFLLLSFPLGLIFFLVTVIGFTLGVSTLILWIGLPMLFATLVLVRGMAMIERRMVANLLHVSFPYQLHYHDMPQRGFLKRFGNVLRDPLTWTSMIYMIVKLPLGIISFILALVLPIVSLALTLLPLVYLVNLFVNTILLKNGIQSTGIIVPYFIEVRGQFDLVMFARSFIGIPIGLALWLVTRFLLNGLALLSGEKVEGLLVIQEALHFLDDSVTDSDEPNLPVHNKLIFLVMATLIFWLYQKRGGLQLVPASSVLHETKRS